MAGKYGSSAVTVTIESSPGASVQPLTDMLLNGISAKDISEMVESTALSDSARERLPAGIQDGEVGNLEGYYDTTGSTGSHAVLGTVDNGPQDDTREMVITWGDSKTTTIQLRLASYELNATPGELTRFTAEVVVTGVFVWGP